MIAENVEGMQSLCLHQFGYDMTRSHPFDDMESIMMNLTRMAEARTCALPSPQRRQHSNLMHS
jgi:hypothetical protein